MSDSELAFALQERIAELEAEVSYLRTRDKSQGAYIEQVLDELEAENEEDRIAELEAENAHLRADLSEAMERIDALATENERLRDAITKYLRYAKGGALDVLKDAIAEKDDG